MILQYTNIRNKLLTISVFQYYSVIILTIYQYFQGGSNVNFNNFIYIFKILLILYVIPYTLFAQSPAEAEAAAREAQRRLEETLRGVPSGSGTTQSITPVQATRGGIQPSWVDEPYTAYNRNFYIAVVGHAANRAEAEKHALVELVSFFGMSMAGYSTTSNIYSEAVSRGIIEVTRNFQMQEMIVTSTSLDNLVGAQIGNVWESTSGTVFALAFLNREKTISIYSNLILINNLSIEQLITMNISNKFTFDGYARYRLAETIARINARYATVVTMSGGSTSSLNIRDAEYFNREALNIKRNIAIGFDVRGEDHNNRIRDAFARVFNDEGLRTHARDAPYTLYIDINMWEDDRFVNNVFIYCRFTVNANLFERATDSVVFTFIIPSDREGGLNYSQAQSRAYSKIEGMVAERYRVEFKKWLAGLLPKT